MDIPGFDPSTMTYLATQMAQPGVNLTVNVANGSDPFHDLMLPADMHHHHQQADHQSLYAYGSDDLNLHSMQPHSTPHMKRFSNATYEDPFSDVVSAFENPLNNDQNDTETPSIERDNKLLSFSLPTFDYTLLDFSYRRTTLSLSAQLRGMFFLAESPWATAGDAQAPPPTELTCYRRNLFQITGEITLPRMLRYIMTEQGEQIPVIGQELSLGATESTEGNSVKIISVPWKTPANANAPAATEDKVEREPPAIPLDLLNVQDLDTDFASFPFQWKRLQFRIATANNGRRKELQQHFVVRLKVMAVLATGGKIPICEVTSGAIIVRGRSPRNFQSRKDMPLNGSGSARRASHLTQAKSTAGESGRKQSEVIPTSAPLKTEVENSVANLPPVFESGDETNNDYYNWKPAAHQTGAMTALPPPNTSGTYEPGNYAVSSPDMARFRKPAPPPPAPINLSLVEDDSPKANNDGVDGPRSAKKQALGRAPSFTINAINSPDESADLLYEYFPLGLDDWMPPVDAVYRPHVVHHTKLPTDPRDPKIGGKGTKSKRYFSEDVS
ncbi:Hypothetical protein R9X50_00273400 [Acrodontium crateriforme]|uniref:NDT80 domain-containing protein n=1 Tax=Acrodontium crateriforme TaxID=150365 RepID=A0AAQ3M1M0_9PEZI|nr:Hypothetical protein R9X50_00273400 [Acrodontium crateriforme]